jgi:ABC-type dipeptide/oligopeptide/nickel transport system ATPase component
MYVIFIFIRHRLRISAVFERLPHVVLVMLVFIATASVAVAGYNASISGRMSRSRMTALVLVLAGVMLLIVDYDRPISGFIRVSQDSIYSVIAQMQKDLA